MKPVVLLSILATMAAPTSAWIIRLSPWRTQNYIPSIEDAGTSKCIRPGYHYFDAVSFSKTIESPTSPRYHIHVFQGRDCQGPHTIIEEGQNVFDKPMSIESLQVVAATRPDLIGDAKGQPFFAAKGPAVPQPEGWNDDRKL